MILTSVLDDKTKKEAVKAVLFGKADEDMTLNITKDQILDELDKLAKEIYDKELELYGIMRQ